MAMPIRVIEGSEIQAARLASGLTLEALAIQLGTTKSTLSKWERDVLQPRRGSAERISAWLASRRGGRVVSLSDGISAGPPVNSRSAKTVDVEVYIDAELADEAEKYGLNLSELADRALRRELARLEAERWKQENASALAAMSDRIASEGVAGEEHRTYG
jgi:antitoxin CcdA